MTPEEHIKEAEENVKIALRVNAWERYAKVALLHLQIAVVQRGGAISLDKP